ncbi:MAG: nitrite/sulfite reductase [Polyangiaceae bacterium]|jgi:sulfite reductase beta subunit-like hemoprotein
MNRPVHLPKFSDKRDIVEFVDVLASFERGEIGPDEFRAFRLLRGVYGQRQADAQMLRIKIPFGRLGPDQLVAIADVADRYSRGFGHVTTRQNIQLHFLKLEDSEAAMRRLDEAGLTTREACGNSVRNVTACELSEVCKDAPFDVTPHAEAVVRHFLGHPLSSSLPRKFKIAFSGCGHDCALGAIHDLGFVARVQDGRPGFKVYAAGGLSTTPQAAITLQDFLPAEELGRLCEAVVRLFHALGNRQNKSRARLKYVLRKLGEEGFRAKYAEARAAVDAEAPPPLALPERLDNTPAPPVVHHGSDPDADYVEWRDSNVVEQRHDGYRAVYIRLVLGDITSHQLRALAQLLSQFGDGTVRLTVDQNLLVPWVDQRSLPAMHAALSAIDLARAGVHTARDVTSCPGAETCNLAVTSSRQVARAIADRLGLSDAGAGRGATIKVSGCPNSCGQHHIADIGWHGAAKTVDGVTVPMYQLHLGGGVDENGARFGRQVVKVIAKRVPEAVAALMSLFETERTASESPSDYFRRVDPKRVATALGELVSLGPAKGEEVDVGATTGFEVSIGAGECAS